MNYAVLGIKDFNNNYSYISFLSEVYSIKAFPNNLKYFLYSLMSLVIVLLFVFHRFYLIIKSKNKHYSYVESLVFFYSLSAFACMYPIRDLTHLFPAIMPLFALMIVSVFKWIKRIINNIPVKYNKIFITWLLIITFVIALYPLFVYLGFRHNLDNKREYNGKYYVVLDENYGLLSNLVVTNGSKLAIDAVLDYEKENNCLILDYTASMFHLINNKYYKHYDLFMRGNFGVDGEDKIIEDLESKKDLKLLVSYDDKDLIAKNRNQIPDKVINYVYINELARRK
jgi:hypothetical protein